MAELEDAADVSLEALEEDTSRLDITNTDMDFNSVLSVAEDRMAQEILSQVSDLGKYMKEVEDELDRVEHESVPEYIKEAERFAELYNEIGACDKILEAFEALLSQFQDELLDINSDIKALQDASVASNTKIQNRSEVIKQLAHLTGEFSVPRELIKNISRGEVNGYYVAYVEALSKKIAFFEAHRGRARACADVEGRLGAVAQTAVARVASHLTRALSNLGDLPALRRAQADLSQLGPLFQFLYKYDDAAAEQVLSQYVDVASRLWFSYCKAYAMALTRAQTELARKVDMLGAEDAVRKQGGTAIMSSLFAPIGVRDKPRVSQSAQGAFTLGKRASVLADAQSGQPPLSPPKDGELLAIEAIWRSLLSVFGDLAAGEAGFARDFFLGSTDVASRVVTRVSPLWTDWLTAALAACFDCVGVALIVRVCEIALLRGAGTPGFSLIEPHVRALEKQATARLSALMELHIASVRAAGPKTHGAPQNLSPHVVARRYAELLASLLSATEKCGPDVLLMLDGVQAALSVEMERLLMRLAEAVPDLPRRTMFLLNNYDLVRRLMKDRGMRGDDYRRWQELLETATHNFMDQQLLSVPAFSQIVQFVSSLRPVLDDQAALAAHPKFTRECVEAALRDFSQGWRKGVDMVKLSVLENFSEFSTGSSAFTAIIEQVYNYYRDLATVVKTYFKELRHSPFFVAETEILHEMQKVSNIFPTSPQQSKPK